MRTPMSLEKLFWIVEATHELRKARGGYVSASTLFDGAKKSLQILNQFNPILLGGFSMGYHSEPRATQDFDLTLAPEDLNSVFSTLQKEGFIKSGLSDFNGVNIHHFEGLGGFKLDILEFTNKDFQKKIAKNAIPHEMFGEKLSVISAEDLIATKLLSFRPKDKIDILTLLEDSSLELNLSDIKSTAQMLKIFNRYSLIEENLPPHRSV